VLESLEPYVSAARSQPVDEFTAVFPHRVLVVESFEALTSAAGFDTLAGGRAGHGPERSVVPLKKRLEANAFASMITIGRSPNNDVVIPYEGVSKFHAYVMVDAKSGNVTITDAGSSNGTTVRGNKLVPRTQRAPLSPGDDIGLGDLKMKYLDPSAFYELLRQG
jgi:pSer/pThr/pTyr-binding forkhead associated (FHA) protein